MPSQKTTTEGAQPMKAKSPERLASEAEREVSLALQPDISYHKALSSRFTLDQTTYTVGDCPSEVFKRFIEGCGQPPCQGRSWNPAKQKKLLSMLDKDCSEVARWYAIDTLLEHKVTVPLERGKERPTIRTP
jgi:hypothetical protein